MKMGNLMPVERAMGPYQNNMKNYVALEGVHLPSAKFVPDNLEH